MRSHVLLATLALAGCGRSEGVEDKDLGTLVIAPKEKRDPIDLAKAVRDPGELGRALHQPYRDVIAALGPHTFTVATTNTVSEAGKTVSDLSDHSVLGLGAKDAFHGEYTNSADYGREVLFVDGMLYLRPRYQRWHGRAPEAPDEPGHLRDSFVDSIGATWDLLAPAAELTDQGAAQVGGRAGRKIAVKQAPTPRSNPPEPLIQRKWREKRVIENVAGEVVLDADKGVVLSAKLSGSVTFTREGRRFTMKVSLDASASGIGAPIEVAAPPADQVVATPERLREVDDRDFLLQGIAPPLRKNTDGTAVTPQPTPAAPAAGSNSQK